MKEVAELPSKNEFQKLQKISTENAAAGWFSHILEKDGNLPASLVRHFSHSKFSYTKFTLPTHKLKKMKAIARIKIKLSFMDLACFEQLAKDRKSSFKCLLARADLFHRTIDAKKWKHKVPENLFFV